MEARQHRPLGCWGSGAVPVSGRRKVKGCESHNRPALGCAAAPQLPAPRGPGFLVRLPGKARPQLAEQSRLLRPDASVRELGPGRGRGGEV